MVIVAGVGGMVIRNEPDLEAGRFLTVEDAVDAEQVWLDRNRRVSPH